MNSAAGVIRDGPVRSGDRKVAPVAPAVQDHAGGGLENELEAIVLYLGSW